jgi:ABC-type polysaccharide/polyol phosphate export permease
MGVFAFLRAFLGISTGDMPYLVFTFSALVPWTLFLAVINGCAPSIMANASILKKMILPRWIFLMVGTVTAVFDFCMSLLIMFLLMLIYHVPFTVNLLWLPLLLCLLLALALGSGMFITAHGIFRRDYLKMSAYVFQLLFFVSPIFYPMDKVPGSLRQFYILNPLVGLLTGFRNVLGAGKMPDLLLLAYALPTIIIVFALGWSAFNEKSPYFSDVL